MYCRVIIKLLANLLIPGVTLFYCQMTIHFWIDVCISPHFRNIKVKKKKMLFYWRVTTLFELAIYWNSNFKSKAALRPFCHTRGASAMGRISLAKLRSRIIKLRDFLNWGNRLMFSSSPDTGGGGLPTFPSVSTSLPHLNYIFFLILANFNLDFNSIRCRIFPSAKIKRTSVSLYCQAWMLGVSEDCSASPNFLNSQISL